MYRVLKAHSLFQLFVEKPLAIPFHSVTKIVSILLRRPLTFLILVGGISGQGGIKMASATTPSANEPAKDTHFNPYSKANKSTNLGKNGL